MVLLISRLLTLMINTLRPQQNGHHFTDNIFKALILLKLLHFDSYFLIQVQVTINDQ